MKFDFFNRHFYFLTREDQWNKLNQFLHMYLLDRPAALTAVLFCFVILLLMFLSIPAKGRKKDGFYIAELVLYSAVLILIFLLNRTPGEHVMRLMSISEYVTADGYHESMILVSLLDLIVFIPFGVFLQQLAHRCLWGIRISFLGIFAVGIELAQYIFGRGSCSLIDSLFYVAGACIGIGVMRFLQFIQNRILRRNGKLHKI